MRLTNLGSVSESPEHHERRSEADSSSALKEHEILFKMPQTRGSYLN